MALRAEQFQQQAQRIADEEADYYALIIYQVLINLMPDKDPKRIADEVLRAYRTANEIEMREDLHEV
jgi:hypothetical protein